MPLFLHTYVNSFNYCNSILIIRLHSVKWLQVLPFNTNYLIQHLPFVCTQLNGSNYCYVSLIIQLNNNHLFTQLNDQTVLFQTIQFSISHLFAFSLNVKQFYLTPLIEPYQVLPLRIRVDLGVMAMKGYTAFAKVSPLLDPHYQMVYFHIQDTCCEVEEFYPSVEKQSVYSTAPADWVEPVWDYITTRS